MISIVMPVLNESRVLAATLVNVREQRGRFEVIVVDGGSADGSVAIAWRCDGVRVLSAPRGRGAQMNAGARLARGDMLLFLHADTLLPAGAIAQLNALAAQGDVWGGFNHRFSGADHDWRLALISALHNWRCRKTNIVYGDQAMFVSRRLFERCGGFVEAPMEDIALSERLRECMPPTLLQARVVTNSRKFTQMGVWRSLWRVVSIVLRRRLRLSTESAFFAEIR